MRYKVVSPLPHPLATKQKRGPGFKYASNLPGSLLKESRKETSGLDIKEEPSPTFTMETASPTVPMSSLDRRKAEREDASSRARGEEPPRKRVQPPHPEAQPRPKLEENPLRKKRKLFDTDAEPSARKKVHQTVNTHDFEESICSILG